MSIVHSDGDDSDCSQEDFENMHRGPVRCDQCSKTAAEAGLSGLKLCAACHSAPYCSVECQRQNWKIHKVDCRRVTSGALAREALSYSIGNIGDGKRQSTRTMGQVLQDLSAWALEHNGDTLTIAAWHALGLLDDLEARKSKVLLLGLCRTQVHDNPRLYYTLKEARVVLVADLKRIFKHRSQHPGRLLRQNEQIRLKDGAIGAMLVMSVEQTADDTRTVVEAVGQISTMTFQPLGVFDVHLESVRRLHGGVVSETMWKACLANSLNGGRFFPMFVPYQPEQ